MTDPTLTVKIDRSGLAVPADDLVFSGNLDETELGIVRYVPPAMMARIGYMPNSRYVDGSEATSAAWEQAMLGFDWVPDTAEDETAIQAAYDEVLEAIGQFSYVVKTQVSGAPEQFWKADRGSMIPNGRTLIDLKYLVPVYGVTIPVYPIPGSS